MTTMSYRFLPAVFGIKPEISMATKSRSPDEKIVALDACVHIGVSCVHNCCNGLS